MGEVHLTPMTPDELDAMLAVLIPSYAQNHVDAGNWTAQESLDRALAQTKHLLPDGVDTEGTLLRTARNDDGEVIGRVWIALRASDFGGAWIYEIEIDEAHRGAGYGRSLLEAAEQEAARHGATSIGLNVFGPNQVARDLYSSAGYEIRSLQMSKHLGGTT